jgi:hypothetical protein
MKTKDKYPNLDDLLGAYFNQDWDEDYDTPEAVISGFAQDGDKKGIEDTINELKTLLKEEHTQNEWLRIIYDDFGCFCNPEHGGIQPTDWLKKIQKQLENELALAEKKDQEHLPEKP